LRLFVFILLDYFATLGFCTMPQEEANPYARIFLENYGVAKSLTMFVFLINFPIYQILCFDSHLIVCPPRLTRIVEPLVAVILAWFLAGAHFNGAASWFWAAPNLILQATGLSLYLVIVTGMCFGSRVIKILTYWIMIFNMSL